MAEGATTARIILGTQFCLAVWPGHAGGLTPVGLLACCDVGQDAGSLSSASPRDWFALLVTDPTARYFAVISQTNHGSTWRLREKKSIKVS
jgi:hypothetical protein